jgi:hypothetical protein
MSCQNFDHGENAVWGQAPAGVKEDEWWNSPVERERRFELNPLDPRHKWPRANELYSAAWMKEWMVLAEAIRNLDELEPNTIKFVVGLDSDEPRVQAMHLVFTKLLKGGSPTRLVKELARTRAMLVPGANEVRRRGSWKPNARFELAHYFNWLLSSFGPRWEPPKMRSPAPPVLHEVARGVLEILRRESSAGRGTTAKELSTSVKRTQDRVRRILAELKRDGHRITNRGGGSGYYLEPPV